MFEQNYILRISVCFQTNLYFFLQVLCLCHVLCMWTLIIPSPYSSLFYITDLTSQIPAYAIWSMCILILIFHNDSSSFSCVVKFCSTVMWGVGMFSPEIKMCSVSKINAKFVTFVLWWSKVLHSTYTCATLVVVCIVFMLMFLQLIQSLINLWVTKISDTAYYIHSHLAWRKRTLPFMGRNSGFFLKVVWSRKCASMNFILWNTCIILWLLCWYQSFLSPCWWERTHRLILPLFASSASFPWLLFGCLMPSKICMIFCSV